MKETNKTLKFAKTREVKSPEKAHATDAGYDFYVPTNLNITDFTKNAVIYKNEFLVSKELFSPSFLVKNKVDNRELWIRFRLNENNNIVYYNLNKFMKEIDQKWNNWIEDKNTYVISIDMQPGDKILIPSGIHVDLPSDIFLDAQNKSGIASKRGLVIGAATIDSGYQGEIHINLINVSNTICIINANDKIVQFLPHVCPNMNTTEEFSITDLYKETVINQTTNTRR